MKKMLSIAIAMAILFTASSCEKDDALNENNNSNNLPHSAPPSGLVGNWVSGFVSMTQLVDAYDGHYVGNAWQSGKYFKITADGKNAEFYYLAQAQYSQSATKASGTIDFDPGSNSTTGSFTFYASSAHYKGWGSTIVDRNATASELKNNLTTKYFYKIEGQWLRIEPNGPVNQYSSSFKLTN